MKSIDLSGFWQAIDLSVTNSSALPAHFFEAKSANIASQKISVPAHWQTQIGFESSPGPLVYRHPFTATTTPPKRSWLEFSGVCGHASVWIDGSYVGDIDCPHAIYAFEIKNGGNDHFVALEVAAPQDAPWHFGTHHAGGIWRPVRLFETGTSRIARLRAMCNESNTERAVLTFHAEVDAGISGNVRTRTVIYDGASQKIASEHEFDKTLASGSNRLQWSVTIESPHLWWPHSLGEQPLYRAEVEVRHSDADQPSDKRTLTTGLRSIHFDKRSMTVNGEPVALRIQEQPLLSMTPASTDVSMYVERIVAAKETNIGILHVADHVEADAFYEAADEFGMLIWQGLPTMKRRDKHRARAERLTRQTIEHLAHRPSVAAWTHDGGRFGRHVIEKSDPSRSVAG